MKHILHVAVAAKPGGLSGMLDRVRGEKQQSGNEDL